MSGDSARSVNESSLGAELLLPVLMVLSGHTDRPQLAVLSLLRQTENDPKRPVANYRNREAIVCRCYAICW
jgi:hypothetical protein